MSGIISSSVAINSRHTKVLRELITTLKNSEPQRMTANGRPRVNPDSSTSNNTPSQRVIRSTVFSHERRTRNNIPMPIIFDDELVVESRTPVNNDAIIIISNTPSKRQNIIPGPNRHAAVLPTMAQARADKNTVIPPGINLVQQQKSRAKKQTA